MKFESLTARHMEAIKIFRYYKSKIKCSPKTNETSHTIFSHVTVMNSNFCWNFFIYGEIKRTYLFVKI